MQFPRYDQEKWVMTGGVSGASGRGDGGVDNGVGDGWVLLLVSKDLKELLLVGIQKVAVAAEGIVTVELQLVQRSSDTVINCSCRSGTLWS
jgi:hypothetical protein